MISRPFDKRGLRRVKCALAAAGLALLSGAAAPAAAADATAPAPAQIGQTGAAGPVDGGRRPKVCLVLSGGGARGAAHIGVLKVLQELRVPVDCIAGTSMGALVGAAYATGMPIAEMDRITSSITAELLFKENPPREELAMRRKLDDYTILFTPEIGVTAGKPSLPKGVVSGVQLETVLRQLSMIKGYQNFDKLPIPYRAVATNLVTGKAVVFKEGELANVMRASMSVPGAMAPAELDGMMLVDGMLTGNLPVEVALDMNPDVIIAVNVGTPLLKREQIGSVIGVVGQMISILTEQNVQTSLSKLRPQDILISPDLGDFTTADFDSLAKIVPAGETAARRASAQLSQLSLPEAGYAALRRRQQVAAAPDQRIVDKIVFEGLKRVNPITVAAVMQTRAGEPIDQATLDLDMRRLYGTGDFEHVNYRYIDRPGSHVLAVDAVEKSWGPDYLRLGLGLSSDFSGGAYWDILASYRRTWLNSYGAEWRIDTELGRTSGLWTEFYQPLSPEGRFFVAPHLQYSRHTDNFYSGSTEVASYDFRTALYGIDIGSQFTHYGELRLGYVGGTARGTPDSGRDDLPIGGDEVAVGAIALRVLFDQLDSVRLPRAGWRANVRVLGSDTRLGAASNFTRWEANGLSAYSFGEHTFQVAGTFGGRIGSDPLPFYGQFQWGGFLKQSGFKTGALYGSSMQFGRLVYSHELYRMPMLEGAYGGLSLEIGRVDNPVIPGSPTGWLRSGALFVASDTPVGPVYLGYGYAHGGYSSWYFYLGRPY